MQVDVGEVVLLYEEFDAAANILLARMMRLGGAV